MDFESVVCLFRHVAVGKVHMHERSWIFVCGHNNCVDIETVFSSFIYRARINDSVVLKRLCFQEYYACTH